MGNSIFIFCKNDNTTCVKRQSSYSHSYNDYIMSSVKVDKKQMTGVTQGQAGLPKCQYTVLWSSIGGIYVLNCIALVHGSNQVCLPDSPTYDHQYSPGAQQIGLIYLAKYDTETYLHLQSFHGKFARYMFSVYNM